MVIDDDDADDDWYSFSYLCDGSCDYRRGQRGVHAASQSSAVWTAAKHNPHLPVHPVLEQDSSVNNI